MGKPGIEFEKAVFEFAKALDTGAEVLFNHTILDRDSGTPRQCDVWIKASFGGHWPMSILVSCKDHARKLDIGDIGTFCDEVRSTRANMGVIYSKAGFTQHAIEKAKANNIACCRLYQNEPADIPLSLVVPYFVFASKLIAPLLTSGTTNDFTTWNSLFNMTSCGVTLLDHLLRAYEVGENESWDESVRLSRVPADWHGTLGLALDTSGLRLEIQLKGFWMRFSASAEATLLNGSYCLSEENFKGVLSGPAVDTWLAGGSPGETWTEIPDAAFTLPENRMVCVLRKPSAIRDALLMWGKRSVQSEAQS
jgi:hypothetical protein